MNPTTKKILVSAGIAFFVVALPTAAVFAQGTTSITLTNPLGGNCNDLNCVAQKVIQFFLQIAVPIAVVMVLVGGFQMIMAAGNPEQFSKGRKTLMYAAIGLAVVLLAQGVALFIKSLIGG